LHLPPRFHWVRSLVLAKRRLVRVLGGEQPQGQSSAVPRLGVPGGRQLARLAARRQVRSSAPRSKKIKWRVTGRRRREDFRLPVGPAGQAFTTVRTEDASTIFEEFRRVGLLATLIPADFSANPEDCKERRLGQPSLLAFCFAL
jgi:hypothetical protein